METKKVVLYAIGIIIGLGILYKIVVGMMTPAKSFANPDMTIINATTTDNPRIKAVNIFMDFSGSMRGYIDFRTGISPATTCQTSMGTTIVTAMNNMDNSYGIKSTAYCGTNSYDNERFNKAVRDCSCFNKSTTLLDKMIESATNQLTDSTLSIIVSDMVMSYGRTKLLSNHDTLYNYHDLSGLGTNIHRIAGNLKNREFHVALLQYESDYNSHYYCNYTENLKSVSFKDKMLPHRPYYVMIVGTESNLRRILTDHIFNEPVHVYATFDADITHHFATQRMEFNFNGGRKLIHTKRESDSAEYLFSANGTDYKTHEFEWIFTYPAIQIPTYLEKNIQVEYDKNIFSQVSSTVPLQSVNVRMLPFNDLHLPYHKAWIHLNTDMSWVNQCDILNDVVTDPLQIEHKTWGLQTLIGRINEAYRGDTTVNGETIAVIEFNIDK